MGVFLRKKFIQAHLEKFNARVRLSKIAEAQTSNKDVDTKEPRSQR